MQKDSNPPPTPPQITGRGRSEQLGAELESVAPTRQTRLRRPIRHEQWPVSRSYLSALVRMCRHVAIGGDGQVAGPVRDILTVVVAILNILEGR